MCAEGSASPERVAFLLGFALRSAFGLKKRAKPERGAEPVVYEASARRGTASAAHQAAKPQRAGPAAKPQRAGPAVKPQRAGPAARSQRAGPAAKSRRP